jgi:hypothetical protein
MSFSDESEWSELGPTASSSSSSSFSLCSLSDITISGESERRAAGDFERREARELRFGMLTISGDFPILVVCGSASDSSEEEDWRGEGGMGRREEDRVGKIA